MRWSTVIWLAIWLPADTWLVGGISMRESGLAVSPGSEVEGWRSIPNVTQASECRGDSTCEKKWQKCTACSKERAKEGKKEELKRAEIRMAWKTQSEKARPRESGLRKTLGSAKQTLAEKREWKKKNEMIPRAGLSLEERDRAQQMGESDRGTDG